MENMCVTVRFWAGAREAAGTELMSIPAPEPIDLVRLREEVLDRVGETSRDRLARVVASCSVLVDDLPVGSADPATVLVRAGQHVEMLPPFAGG